jgi:predicted HicB family RNase H-like nuclease
MHCYSLRVMWSDEDEAYIATTPEFPLLSAFADTPQDAINELVGVLEDAIEYMQEEGMALPSPQKVLDYSGQFRLRLPKSLHAALVARAEREGVSLNTLATQLIAEGMGAAKGVASIQEEMQGVLRGLRQLPREVARVVSSEIQRSQSLVFPVAVAKSRDYRLHGEAQPRLSGSAKTTFIRK